jgi:predicted enzyme related to lactoylglutathione lyase
MAADRNDEDDELIALLARLPRERVVPRALERNTINALRVRGLLRSSRRVWWFGATAAAAIAVFAAAWIAGSRLPQTAGTAARYMLLLYSGDSHSTADDASVAEYRDWARNLRNAGLHISGERLDETPAAVLGGDAREPGRHRLRGYFVFEAADDRNAVEIAKQHPHLRRGGVVMLHRIRPTIGASAQETPAPRPPQGVEYRPTVLVQIGVADLNRAIEFYTEMLGFQVTERRDDLQFAHLATNVAGLQIGLSQQPAPKGSGSVLLNIGVTDVRTARRALEAKGVVFRRPTVVIPNKVALAEFVDRDGNLLRFAGPPFTEPPVGPR